MPQTPLEPPPVPAEDHHVHARAHLLVHGQDQCGRRGALGLQGVLGARRRRKRSKRGRRRLNDATASDLRGAARCCLVATLATFGVSALLHKHSPAASQKPLRVVLKRFALSKLPVQAGPLHALLCGGNGPLGAVQRHVRHPPSRAGGLWDAWFRV